MGFRMKQNISVLNVQPWLLKKNLAKTKKNKNLHRMLLVGIIFFFLLLLVSFARYSQSSYTAMYNGGSKTAVIFSSHSALAIKNWRLHG